jgi:hypothetical protein
MTFETTAFAAETTVPEELDHRFETKQPTVPAIERALALDRPGD